MFIGHQRRVLEQYKEAVDAVNALGEGEYTSASSTNIKNFVRQFNREGYDFFPTFEGITVLEQSIILEMYGIQLLGIPAITNIADLLKEEFVELLWTIDPPNTYVPPPLPFAPRNHPFHIDDDETYYGGGFG